MAKTKKIVFLVLLTSLLTLAALSITPVQAQTQATITVLDSLGGITDPAPGTYNYTDGTSVTFTADPSTVPANFGYWIITSNQGSRTVTDNPMTFTVTGGTEYEVQAVFTIIQPVQTGPVDLSTSAIVVLLAAAGGTTSPPPGTYALADATNMNLTAAANSGWMFSHWVITGELTSHGPSGVNLEPTDNPYNVNHGYGARIVYQPVFTQTNPSPTPSPTIPEFSVLGLLMLLAAMIPIVVIVKKQRLPKLF